MIIQNFRNIANFQHLTDPDPNCKKKKKKINNISDLNLLVQLVYTPTSYFSNEIVIYINIFHHSSQDNFNFDLVWLNSSILTIKKKIKRFIDIIEHHMLDINMHLFRPNFILCSALY